MRTIGVIGGMSWRSTATYYARCNELVHGRLGGHHSAACIVASVDFAEIEALQRAGAWDEAGELLAGQARALERAGAACIVLATNTMHRVADHIVAAAGVPFLHVCDAVAAAASRLGAGRVGLLGTRFTMAEPFYAAALDARGLEVVVPTTAEQADVDRVIYEELVHGRVHERDRARYVQVMQRLVSEDGCEAIVLGCTEIGLLVSASDCAVPLVDTTEEHVRMAVDWALTLR